MAKQNQIPKPFINPILQLIRFDKPIGTFLLLWPSLVALILASQKNLDISLAFVFCLAVFLARSMGCIINDLADDKFDSYVKRTKERVITSGKLTKPFAWTLFGCFGLILFALSFYFNALTVKLAFVALFLMIIYPFSKRFFPIPQLFLGLAYGFSTLMAFAAVNQSIAIESLALYFFVVIWALYYDTLYALVDLNDDLKIGIHSSAIFFGKRVFLAIFGMQIALIITLFYLGYLFNLNLYYYFALILLIATLYYQHQLIQQKNRASFFKAFKHNNITGIAWLLAVLVGLI